MAIPCVLVLALLGCAREGRSPLEATVALRASNLLACPAASITPTLGRTSSRRYDGGVSTWTVSGCGRTNVLACERHRWVGLRCYATPYR